VPTPVVRRDQAGPNYNEHYSFFGTRAAKGCERREKKACPPKVRASERPR
jgi:hypothetical protein